MSRGLRHSVFMELTDDFSIVSLDSYSCEYESLCLCLFFHQGWMTQEISQNDILRMSGLS